MYILKYIYKNITVIYNTYFIIKILHVQNNFLYKNSYSQINNKITVNVLYCSYELFNIHIL